MDNKLVNISLYVNGKEYSSSIPANLTLLEFLREKIRLMGVKDGCNSSHCGACTVLLEGNAVNSCTTLAVQADGKHITTIEGLSDGKELHPIQEAFIEEHAIQCGFCTPGMIMSAQDLLSNNPNPTDFEIKEALSGNLCRCTGYTKIVDAVRKAATKLEDINEESIKKGEE